jgi:hypothetical protein
MRSHRRTRHFVDSSRHRSASTRDALPPGQLQPGRTTKLELFLRSRGIKPAHVARESGYCRQHLLRIRMGRIDPSTRCTRAIVEAVRRLSGEHLRASDLFGEAAIRAGMPG